jgi:hypothetical protein
VQYGDGTLSKYQLTQNRAGTDTLLGTLDPCSP